MQEEDEIYARIIKDSQQKLLALELLSNFFNHKNLMAALIKTKIIHNLFQSNRNLDINKLELFHIQFTSSLIDLFRKLKKKKEQQYLLTAEEIHINEEVILKLQAELADNKFPEQMKVHARLMSQKIAQLYNMLVAGKSEAFSWNEITNESGANCSEYYREIKSEQYHRLAATSKQVYQNNFCKIERRLLGRLNILQFRIKFLCGFTNNGKIIEVYEFRDSNDLFIFIAADKSFYFLEDEMTTGLDLSKNISARQEVINQLKIKNGFLNEQLGTLKTNLPENVQDVLIGYVDKISSVDFVNDLQNVDEQTNILKSMLNININ